MIGADKIIQKKKEFLFPSSHGNHFYKNPPQKKVSTIGRYLHDLVFYTGRVSNQL